MKTENYNKIMRHLDLIEALLNNVAAKIGHDNFEEFIKDKVNTDNR